MKDEEKIILMQNNFKGIRAVLGWTQKTASEKMGVSRQTISNIDAGRSKLTKTMYLAICYLIEEEIKNNPNKSELVFNILIALGFTDGLGVVKF